MFIVASAHRINGFDCFPLDDPWIHLTYARNLAHHGSFSYFPGDPSSSGSTAPLYTLLLALGFHLTDNEKVLSYVLGILCHGAFLTMAVLWARRRLADSWLVACFVLVLAFDWRIAILSASGMETSLFMFLVATAFWARSTNRWRTLGTALGLGVWTRPDMLILAGIFILDTMVPRPEPPRPGSGEKSKTDRHRAAIAWLAPFAILLGVYFAFNLIVGGTLVPNTFAAKRAYAQNVHALHFVTHGLRESLLVSAFWLLTPLAMIGLGAQLTRFARGRSAPRIVEAAFAVALPVAYMVLVPHTHRFDRYLVPALPAIALLGLAVVGDTCRALSRAGSTRRNLAVPVRVLALLAALSLAAVRVPRAAEEYRQFCRFHYVRHEQCGRWIHDHTPATAVIATHDVGAIAFYSGRRVVDMVGLIQRDAIPHLHRPDYTGFLASFFADQHVTHVVVLDSWLEVANQPELWVSQDIGDLLHVYAWIPGRTFLVPEQVTALKRRAMNCADADDYAGAATALAQALEITRDDADIWYWVGIVREQTGHYDQAIDAFSAAIRLHPTFRDARFHAAVLLARAGKYEDALSVVEPVYQSDPGYPGLAGFRENLVKRIAGNAGDR